MHYRYDVYSGIQKYKTKTFIILAALGFVLASSFMSLAVFRNANASVSTVPGPWQITAPSPLVFGCGGGTYSHTLDTVSQTPGGDITGTGSYDANDAYTWNISGNVSGDDVEFTVVYTGLNPGYTLNGVGTIATNGSIDGTTNGNCQTFALPAGSATRFEGNHGQYVRSQDDKKAAAQSRIGMPVQSKGHTLR